MFHKKFAHLRYRRNSGDGSIHPFFAQMRVRAISVNQKKQLFVAQLKIENRLSHLSANRGPIVGGYFVFVGQPGYRSIERSAIYVGEAKPSGELASNCAFP